MSENFLFEQQAEPPGWSFPRREEERRNTCWPTWNCPLRPPNKCRVQHRAVSIPRLCFYRVTAKWVCWFSCWRLICASHALSVLSSSPFVDWLFLIGGDNSAEVSAFDVVEKQLWNNVPPMSETRRICAVASSARDIIVCGGGTENGRYLTSCELFQPSWNR